MNPLRLIAASDDYLLDEARDEVVAELAAALGVEPEVLAEDVTPETVAVEISSPSLFASERLLVVEDVRPWLDTTAPPEAPKSRGKVDLEPLLVTLADGVPEGMALVLGAWCGRKPKGALVDAVAAAGEMRWIPAPAPPKPWETVALSDEQMAVLGRVLRRAAGEVTFSRRAAHMLMERLGFAPRHLASETTKLAQAAGAGGTVDEALVRELTFPAERSLEVVKGAIIEGRITPVIDLVASAASGAVVRDWQGRRLDPAAVAAILFGQVHTLLAQMLDLRQTCVRLGVDKELDPRRVGGAGWYGRSFKGRLGPRIMDGLDPSSPLCRNGRPPGMWQLGQIFEGATRYRNQDLRRALAAAGDVEASTRGPMALDAIGAWLAGLATAMEEDVGG